MHVVITGSTGLIGRALVPYLLRLAHDLTLLSRRSFESLPHGAGTFTQILVNDLCETSTKDFSDGDAAIHLAGIAHRQGNQDKKAYENLNYNATVHLAELAEARGCQRFVFMSTAKVRAKSTTLPIESSSPYNPPDLYSDTIARAEEYLLSKDWPMAIMALRPPAVIGLLAKANFNHLIRLAKSGVFVPVPKIPNKRVLSV